MFLQGMCFPPKALEGKWKRLPSQLCTVQSALSFCVSLHKFVRGLKSPTLKMSSGCMNLDLFPMAALRVGANMTAQVTLQL